MVDRLGIWDVDEEFIGSNGLTGKLRKTTCDNDSKDGHIVKRRAG